jgi:hypothetical protein
LVAIPEQAERLPNVASVHLDMTEKAPHECRPVTKRAGRLAGARKNAQKRSP